MRLELYIRKYLLAEEEIILPHFPELSFEDNCTIRQFYVDCIRRKMELDNLSAVRGREPHFILKAESWVSDFEDEEDIIQMNGLKKVV